VQYAKKHRSILQKHKCGVKDLLDTPKRQRVIKFVIVNKRERRMFYIQVNAKLELFVFDKIIRKVLAKEDYYRRVARKKPSIFKKNRVLRLA